MFVPICLGHTPTGASNNAPFSEGFLEGVLQWALMGRRVLRRVLRRGSKKGLSRRHLEARSTPFREYDPVGVCPNAHEDAVQNLRSGVVVLATTAQHGNCYSTECTKIAHRHSLAIFTADEGIAGNSAARTNFTHFLRRRNRGSLAFFFAEEIAHLGASKNRAIFWGAVKIAAATAENRAILVHSATR